MTPEPEMKSAAAILGAKGGANGTGKSKKRSKAHYRRIAKLSHKARKDAAKTKKTK